ncbi:hypothetical protein [Ensifer adhaerens]|uniref:hypothetical protein n=1 Tax=Ensifer adhaerens TaxID=106592 RepID=UPI000CF1B630|nr:hypothetical protein [Ensifer adhaerens]
MGQGARDPGKDRHLSGGTGTDKTKLLTATIFVTDLGKKPEMDAVWKAWAAADDLGGDTLIEVVVSAFQ